MKMMSEVDKIILDLQQDTALLLQERSNKETELECLYIGKKRYEELKSWVNVAGYQVAIQRVKREIDTLNELIEPRLEEIRRAQENLKRNMQSIIDQTSK